MGHLLLVFLADSVETAECAVARNERKRLWGVLVGAVALNVSIQTCCCLECSMIEDRLGVVGLGAFAVLDWRGRPEAVQ